VSNRDRELASIACDPDVFEAFYRRNLESVQRFVARRVDEPHRAADLTAEIFLAAMRAAHRYDAAKAPERAWLLGVARLVVAEDVRKRARELHAVSRLAGRRELAPDAMARIEDRIDAERSSRALYRALSDLSEKDRALVEMVAVDGLPVAEAAAALGLKPTAARVRLHRSRARLQAQLWPSACRIQEEVL